MVHGQAEGIGHVRAVCTACWNVGAVLSLVHELKVLSGRLGVLTLANYLSKKLGSLGLIDAFLFLNLCSGSVQPSRKVFLNLISTDR